MEAFSLQENLSSGAIFENVMKKNNAVADGLPVEVRCKYGDTEVNRGSTLCCSSLLCDLTVLWSIKKWHNGFYVCSLGTL